MTFLHLHGFVPPFTPDGPNAPDHLRVDLGGLVALATVASAPREDGDAAIEDTLALGAVHHALLCASIEAGDVLPVRPGAVFSGEDALRQALVRRVPDYLKHLERISGQVEFAVHCCRNPALNGSAGAVAESASAAPPASERQKAMAPSGRAFLATRRNQRAARRSRAGDRRSFVAGLVNDLHSFAEAQSPLATADQGVLAHVAFLVMRTNTEGFLAALERLAPSGEALGLDLSVMGPLPPYAFAGHAQESQKREAAHV
ncbi:MAG: GvpL/GvpF family gas vesicle protein [Pseudomonadota bacterium]